MFFTRSARRPAADRTAAAPLAGPPAPVIAPATHEPRAYVRHWAWEWFDVVHRSVVIGAYFAMFVWLAERLLDRGVNWLLPSWLHDDPANPGLYAPTVVGLSVAVVALVLRVYPQYRDDIEEWWFSRRPHSRALFGAVVCASMAYACQRVSLHLINSVAIDGDDLVKWSPWPGAAAYALGGAFFASAPLAFFASAPRSQECALHHGVPRDVRTGINMRKGSGHR